MLTTTPTTPTYSTLSGLTYTLLAETLAAWRRRVEARRAANRLEAEMASMTHRERLDIDVTRANNERGEYKRANA